jgi:hypothetical protein
MSEWILGREGSIKIDDPAVSRIHAKLTLEGDDYYIEDLGSTHGTFVNGSPVKRKKVSLYDKVMLGSHEVDLSSLDLAKPDSVFNAEMLKLKGVREQYVSELDKLESESVSKMTMVRVFPMAPGMLLGLSRMFFSGMDTGGTVALLAFSGVLTVVGLLLGARYAKKLTEKRAQERRELVDNFQLAYCCPDCKNPFGEKSWELLRRQGKCLNCKRTFVV